MRSGDEIPLQPQTARKDDGEQHDGQALEARLGTHKLLGIAVPKPMGMVRTLSTADSAVSLADRACFQGIGHRSWFLAQRPGAKTGRWGRLQLES